MAKTPKIQTPVHYKIIQAGSALTNGAGEVEFNLGTATIIKTDNAYQTVDALLNVVDDVANTRTQFQFLEDCLVEVYGGFRCNALAQGVEILKNGSIELLGTTPRAATDVGHTAGTIAVVTGDYLTLTSGFYGDNAGAVTSSANPVIFTLRITKLS